jgi:ergothioneine biosynthesis protein EgtB
MASLIQPMSPAYQGSPSAPSLARRYAGVRGQTEALCQPLEIEDYVVSSMPDVSPTKWHLAHTTWFFETFILAHHAPAYRSPNPRYAYLFNSYYVQAGERHCRAQRGLATRPTVAEVFAYRRHVDCAMQMLIEQVAGDTDHPAYPLIELGLHHEQQHQELLLMDIKHVFWTNPLRPTYRRRTEVLAPVPPRLAWHPFAEGIRTIGHAAGHGFAYDNESPQHRVFLNSFRLASRLITNGEYLEFIEDGGYRRPDLLLSAGLAAARDRNWEAPLYWEKVDDRWHEFTLAGMLPVDPAAPVCHVSYYEADAYARWAGFSLPTEAEWEMAAADHPIDGTFVESRRFHPEPAPGHGDGIEQLYGDLWQWTASAYTAYPGYHPAPGAIGEYNGKWMADQWVLRGASCATPRSHARTSYRNFFPSDARWQFAGIRLAERA